MSSLTLESMLQRYQEASILFSVSPVHLYLWPSHNAAASACPRCPAFLQLLILACRRLRPFVQTNLCDEVTSILWRLWSFGCISTIFHIIFDMNIAQVFFFNFVMFPWTLWSENFCLCKLSIRPENGSHRPALLTWLWGLYHLFSPQKTSLLCKISVLYVKMSPNKTSLKNFLAH